MSIWRSTSATRVFVVTADDGARGTVRMFDAGRGRVYALLSSPYGRDNVLDGPGAIAVLDAATGAVRTVVPLRDTVGGGPNFGIAVDTRLHHLIVLTDNYVTTLDATHL